jgi:positive regulator of sigma E activity
LGGVAPAEHVCLASFSSETKAVRRRRPGKYQQVQQDQDLHPDTDVELGIEETLERHVLPLLHPVQLPLPLLVLAERVL